MSTLGALGRVGLAADPAAEQSAQQVLAAHPSGPLPGRRPLVQPLLHRVEGLPGHQGGPGVLDPHRLARLLVLALDAPDGGSGVGFVGQQVVDDVLLPAPSPVGDAPAVQFLADLHQPVAPAGTLEYLPNYRRGRRVNLQGGAFLHPVADLDSSVAEGCLGAEEEAPGGGLPHPPHNLGG